MSGRRVFFERGLEGLVDILAAQALLHRTTVLSVYPPSREDCLQYADVLQSTVQALTIERDHRVRRVADDDRPVFVMIRTCLDGDEGAPGIALKVVDEYLFSDQGEGVREVVAEPGKDL